MSEPVKESAVSPVPPRSRRRRGLMAVLLALIVTAAVPAGASGAGIYHVTGTCGLWEPWTTGGLGTSIYAQCPTLVARNTGGAFSTAAGVSAGWVFRPPAGTVVDAFRISGAMSGRSGWQAALYNENGHVYEDCPGPSCPGASKPLNDSGYLGGGNAVIVRVRCGASSCPNNQGVTGQFNLQYSTFTIVDFTYPTVAIGGGTLIGGGWQSGVHTLAIDANDNSGISEYRAYIDGNLIRRAPAACNFGWKVPCPSGRAVLEVSTRGLTDGPHKVTAEAVDAAGNTDWTGAEIYTDNTPPTQPQDLAVEGGSGWRAQETVKVSWRNPPQTSAPITGAAYRLCPALPENASAAQTAERAKRCVTGRRSGARLTAIKDLELPAPGIWNLSLWLVDGAGNHQPASAVEVKGLGFDDTPPGALAFVPLEADDPTRVRVRAVDAESGIAGGTVEVRRDGEQAWRPLPTQASADGLTAVLDDETLAKGLYFLRARAVNRAGLEASTDRDAAGQPAMARLPLRLASRVSAGRKGTRTCRGRGKARACRYRLVTKPRLRVGQATRLYGRLLVAGRALPGAGVEVWRRLELSGAGWARVGTVTTSRTGRFSYRARRGPARTIRFRYPGTAKIRGHNRDVALRVRASTSMRASRRSVINGEFVTFRGRLRGGWLPPAGALVELQVYSRGQWRTFAQPRARSGSGRWSYPYRFETVRGRASFRFRARVRRQPGFPFITGSSRPVRVLVRGL